MNKNMKRLKWNPTLNLPNSVYSDKWFVLESHGGLYPGIYGKPNLTGNHCLPNCVGWVWASLNSRSGGQYKDIGSPTNVNYPYSAHHWYNSSPDRYKRTSVPEIGAVACWKHKSGTYGHVVIVEKVNDNGSWVSSESVYGGTAFKSRTFSRKSTLSGFIFQGFLVNKDVEWYMEEPHNFKVGDKVLVTKQLAKQESEITKLKEDGSYEIQITVRVKESEIERPLEKLQVGNKVKILSAGNSNSYGSGYNAYGIGWVREILRIYPDRPYPYQVGNEYGTTGFYKESALEKV